MKSVLDIMEAVGVFAFAVSGAHVAMEKKMDLLGTFVLALVTAAGGGVLRDVVMDVGIPKFFSSYLIVLLSLLAVLFTMAAGRKPLINQWVLAFDAVGLSAFSVDAGIKAIGLGYNLPEILFTSVITDVGGGVLRDILAQRVPVIFRREIYASASILGVLFLRFTYSVIGAQTATGLSLLLIFTLRMVSVRHGLNLPAFKPKL